MTTRYKPLGRAGSFGRYVDPRGQTKRQEGGKAGEKDTAKGDPIFSTQVPVTQSLPYNFMQNRNTKKRAESNRVFDSMAQAAAILDVSKEVLQELKAAGCPAFRGSRVHQADLMEWIRQHKPTPPTDEQEFLRRVHALSAQQAGLVCFVRINDPEGTRWPGADALLADPVLDAVGKLFEIAGVKTDLEDE